MEKIGLLFPGQGSQFPGMGKEVYDTLKEARERMEEASDLLHLDMREKLFFGSEEELQQTELAQPAIFLTSAMYFEWFLKTGKTFHMVAGHSLGEYSALYAAGVLTFAETLLLVQKRGVWMGQVSSHGAMYAVLGLEEAELLKEIQGKKNVVIANLNAKTQFVLSGNQKELEEISCFLEKREGVKIKPLKVSGAFHSPLMKEAAERLNAYVEGLTFRNPRVPVFPNVIGQPTDSPKKIKECLCLQMTGQVRWYDTILAMKEAGADLFCEVGDADILKKMNKTICFRPKCVSVKELFG